VLHMHTKYIYCHRDHGLALLTQVLHSPLSRISLIRPMPLALRFERAVNSITSRDSTTFRADKECC